jgi:nucleotide-binding universal stress UspA family protein
MRSLPETKELAMKSVLVGDDGSEAAACAVAWATAFAAERSAKLVAVSVGVAPDRDGDESGIERLVLPEDHPASGIMEASADMAADLVVLGRRGAGGFPSLPIGTTAHVVAGSCGRPVAIVPPSFRREGRPLVRRVMVGYDGLPGSAAALAWSANVFSDAELTVVHAVEGAGTPDVDLDVPLVDADTVDTITAKGGAAEVLLDAAEQRAADVVVVGRRDHGALRGTLGGVSQRVLAYAPCPAIVMPTRATPGTAGTG